MTKVLIFILIVSKSISGFSLTLNISIQEHQFKIDESRVLIVSQIDHIETYHDLSDFTDLVIQFDELSFQFNQVPNSLSYTDSYTITRNSIQYDLYFTELPLITIETEQIIENEPKVLASFNYSDEQQIIYSNIGIELRGGASLVYPKKSFDIEFWDDEIGEDLRFVQFGDLRYDDDWILDAMYNEPLRLRSFISHKLWLDLHSPYYLDDEPEAKSGVDVKYAELFLNGKYNGVYKISEPIDKRQLKIKSFDGDIRGELYKGVAWGGTTFTYLYPMDNESDEWGGYLIKYLNEGLLIEWDNLYAFTDFVMNAPENQFIEEIWKHFNYDNFSDYFIFLNLLRATDNTGKNIYLAKYDTEESYFYVPWDLDGCFGTIYDGSQQNISNDILLNGFYERILELNPNSFFWDIASRWFQYRENILSTINLTSRFEEQFTYFSENKIYEREALVYPNYSFNQNDFNYLEGWLQNRLTYLDFYFDSLQTSLDQPLRENIKTLIYPSPATDQISFTNHEIYADTEYKIYNLMGILVQSDKIRNNSVSIKKLKPGHYILYLDDDVFSLTIH